jgi:hypothetical protein
VNVLAQSRIHCWVLVLVALEVGVITAEVRNIVAFIVCLFICLCIVYLTTKSVALLM